MAVTLDEGKKAWVVRMEGEVTIAVASECKEVLLRALASGKGLRLDLSHATELDATALQLLWAAEREARVSGRTLVLAGELPEAAAELGRRAGFEKFPVPADSPDVIP